MTKVTREIPAPTTRVRCAGQTWPVQYICGSYAVPGRGSKLFLIGNEYGPAALITANSSDEAWGEWLDSLPPISDAEMEDAFEGVTLFEGYEHQPNATGTGVVDVGHHAWIRQIFPGWQR